MDKTLNDLKKMGGHPRFYELIWQICELHATKNHDYANKNPLSNLRECEKAGIPAHVGVYIRLSDKWSRLTNFIKGVSFKVKEAAIDIYLDIAVYCLLSIILIEENERNPKDKTT